VRRLLLIGARGKEPHPLQFDQLLLFFNASVS